MTTVRGFLMKLNRKVNGYPAQVPAAPSGLGRIAARTPRVTATGSRGAGVRTPAGFHPQAARTTPTQAWRPGQAGGMQPITATPLGAYTGRVSGVPLTGGQGQVQLSGTTAGTGAGSITIGPSGLGTTWYPAQATISTTTGVLDSSTCKVYLGAQGTPILLVGTLFPGGAGTLALAIPDMQPGQYLIFIWTGGTPGDIAAANVVGTMDALSQS